MNFNALSNQIMLFHSGAWLNKPALRAELSSRPLTAAMLSELQLVHDVLAEKHAQRARILAQLGLITRDLVGHDHVHDRKARGLYSLVYGLAEVCDDDSQAALLRALLDKLFPEGLAVINRSYMEESGAVFELQRRIDDETLAFMATVTVGKQTLAELYHEWVAAGVALGEQALERAQLQQAISKEGTAWADVDTRSARLRWIRTVSTLHNIIDMLPLSDEARERLLGPLQRSIAEATRGSGNAPPDEIGDEIGDVPPDGDDGGVDASPGNDTGELDPASGSNGPGNRP